MIVGIDDRTLEEDPNVSFPFNRRRHARVIRQLTKAGASVIAYDVQFTEPSPFPDADEALLQAVRAGKKRVVLGTTEVGLDGSTSIFGGGETLKYSRAIPAITNFANDEDGVLRHMSFKRAPARDLRDGGRARARGARDQHPGVRQRPDRLSRALQARSRS